MKITEEDVIGSIDIFTAVPPILLKVWVRSNSNLTARFREQILEHHNKLSELDRSRLEAVLEMDVDEIQRILRRAYTRTGKKQLKILSDPGAREFIEKNLGEVRKIIY